MKWMDAANGAWSSTFSLVGVSGRWRGLQLTLVGLMVASCGSARSVTITTSPRPAATVPATIGTISTPATAPTTPVAAGAVSTSRREAAHLLAHITVPTGSRAVRRLPGQAFAKPLTLPACNPIEAATARWVVPRSPSQLRGFLTGHVPRSMFVESQSGPSLTSPPTFFVADGLNGSTTNEVVFTFAPFKSGTGLRVDAMFVPHGAACISNG